MDSMLKKPLKERQLKTNIGQTKRNQNTLINQLISGIL